jgi:hypothetical protein
VARHAIAADMSRASVRRAEAPDSVHIGCRDDGSVTVVVRDASMAPALAVRWSLEAACALRGERAALWQVTLNGHTVFRRGGPPLDRPPPPGRLSFAC